MNLRPHHALCIQKFTGHGYDMDFTRHMTGVVSALRDNPDTPVCLVSGPDELCSHCPNCREGRCSTQEKVEIMDARAAALCGVKPGDRLTWAELSGAARERIFAAQGFEQVCSACQWFDLCRNTKI